MVIVSEYIYNQFRLQDSFSLHKLKSISYTAIKEKIKLYSITVFTGFVNHIILNFH